MADWIMVHPWLTFVIIMAVLVTIHDTVVESRK
jgi:hypothetical protein